MKMRRYLHSLTNIFSETGFTLGLIPPSEEDENEEVSSFFDEDLVGGPANVPASFNAVKKGEQRRQKIVNTDLIT
jgi:hypothetical protein